jgi:two-component system sensor histidine kinase ChvG
MRARATILVGALALVLVPLAAMLAAWTYELLLVNTYETRLREIAAEARAGTKDEAALTKLATERGVMLRRVQPDGRVTSQSGNGEEGVWVRGPFEVVSTALEVADNPREGFEEADRLQGPLVDRPEVVAAFQGEEAFAVNLSPGGQTVAMSLAAPFGPDGAVLLVTKASHRGVRRLLVLRREMMRLTLYQAMAALVAAMVLGRWLVKPLERLAKAAQSYPGQPLAPPELLSRKDELGQLARSMAELAASLEVRRREAVDLAGELAHEFKNPLATISAAAEHLGTTRELTDEKRQLLANASTAAAGRLLTMTEALLSLAKLEAGLPQEPRARVGYRAFVEALISEYRGALHPKPIAFEVQIDPTVDQVLLAPDAWERLLRNLLDNAIVHALAGAGAARVQVMVRVTPSGVLTSISDSGPGVSEGNRDKIFRRFFTVRPEGAAPGTGLGLTIAQAIASAHGGKVELVSPPGVGATFQVLLPA